MNVSVGSRWDSFVDDIVKAGRYASASEVMRAGIRSTPHKGYVILFRYLDEAVEIVNMLGAHRDAQGHFADPEPIPTRATERIPPTTLPLPANRTKSRASTWPPR